MIDHKQPLSMAESLEYSKEKELSKFAKGFEILKKDKAEGLRKKLLDLNIVQLNEKHISKIIDFLPQDKEDLSKIINDASLDEDETKKILDAI